jgi:hypothetical protein
MIVIYFLTFAQIFVPRGCLKNTARGGGKLTALSPRFRPLTQTRFTNRARNI